MSMMRSKSGKRLMSDINVTPLVDVMLVLLIIFMITAPMMTQGVNLDLQKNTDQPPKQKNEDEPLVISIDKNGQIKLKDTVISRDDLIQKLHQMSAEMSNDEKMKQKIFIRAAPETSYGQVIPLFAAARNAGFPSISPARPSK